MIIMKELICIVDDEPDIVELIKVNLEKNGYSAVGFYSGEPFLNYLKKGRIPELIILDVMLPDIDGFEIIRSLKTNEKTALTPVIFLSAKGEEVDKIIGFERGADDYITKPFSMKELMARVRAVLKRQSKDRENIITVKDILKIDLNKYEVYVRDSKIDLTLTEFKLLAILAKRPGWVFSREDLLEMLWGSEKVVIDRTIDVHIKNIREKLKEAGGLIVNVRGVGYKLNR